ncbi:MAG: SUMF1/EgtB/PvdO family nonheme iron enzyme, partial [Anaerolineae bacterium]|nr:SUMF1/EgtB/PvdO family nonheme iron enzyme [Anaerolineae bacterium]
LLPALASAQGDALRQVLGVAGTPTALAVRLPLETEWKAAMTGRGDFPWGDTFAWQRLNCAEHWVGRAFKDDDEWREWIGSDQESWETASTSAVTTFPQGVSPAGVWDGSGNVWEWMGNPYQAGAVEMALRGGSWLSSGSVARVSARRYSHPDYFNDFNGFRCVVAPVSL